MLRSRGLALVLLCGTAAVAGWGVARLGGFDWSSIERAAAPIWNRGATASSADGGPVRAALAAATAAYLRGRLYMYEGRMRDALTQLEIAAQLDPQAVAIHASLAQIWRRLGENARALAHAEIACALDPQDRELRREYIGLLVEAERYPEASALLEKEVEAGDGSFETLAVTERGSGASRTAVLDARVLGARDSGRLHAELNVSDGRWSVLRASFTRSDGTTIPVAGSAGR